MDIKDIKLFQEDQEFFKTQQESLFLTSKDYFFECSAHIGIIKIINY